MLYQRGESLWVWKAFIKTIPRLERAEERRLAKLIQAGDQTAIHRLVEANFRFVVHIVEMEFSPLIRPGFDLLDMIQEGNIGLIRAAQNYQPEADAEFSTYAYWPIRSAVQRGINDHRRSIRCPSNQIQALLRHRKQVENLSTELGRAPSREDILTGLQISEKELVRFEQLEALELIESLEALLAQRAEDDGEDFVDETEPEPEEIFLSRCAQIELNRALNDLSPREQKILHLRHGLGGDRPRDWAEISAQFRLSTSRVQQIEQLAVKKLKRNGQLRSLAQTMGQQPDLGRRKRRRFSPQGA